MTTMSRSRGISTDMFLRLCTRALRGDSRARRVASGPYSLIDIRRILRCWVWQVASNRGKLEDCLVISVRDHG